MSKIKIIVGALLLAYLGLAVAVCRGETLEVGTYYEFQTILEAVNSAGDGDTIAIYPGNYEGFKYIPNVEHKSLLFIGVGDREDIVIERLEWRYHGVRSCDNLTIGYVRGHLDYVKNCKVTGIGQAAINGEYNGSISNCIVYGSISSVENVINCKVYNGRIEAGYKIANNFITGSPYSGIRGGQIVCDNVVSNCGGLGIESDGIIERNYIGNNKGSGIIARGSRAIIRNNLIINNFAEYGAGIYIYYGNPTIINNTIVGNYATVQGGGIYKRDGGILSPMNCIIYDNTASQFPNITSNIVPQFSCVGSDPSFISESNFRLQKSSSCIGNGEILPIVGDTDLDKTPRIIDGKIDIGCYQGVGGVNPKVEIVKVINKKRKILVKTIVERSEALTNQTVSITIGGQNVCSFQGSWIVKGRKAKLKAVDTNSNVKCVAIIAIDGKKEGQAILKGKRLDKTDYIEEGSQQVIFTIGSKSYNDTLNFIKGKAKQ